MDFFEKGFQCFYNGKYYHWSSAAFEVNENGKRVISQEKPIPEGVTRGESFYNLMVMERETKDPKTMGKIKLTSLSSVDYGISVPAFVKDQFTKSSMKKWVGDLTKFYAKNNKKI